MAFLHGSEQRGVKRAQTLPAEVPVPADLPDEQRALWLELAPHARAMATLTTDTALAFRDLCEAIVVKRALLSKIEADGLTFVKVSVDGAGVEHDELKSHPLLPQYRGMLQRVEAGLARFRLAPVGKEVTLPEKPRDGFEEFEGGGVVQ